MTGKKGNSGKGKGGNGAGVLSDHVMEFTPQVGFDIRSAARNFSKLMIDTHQALIMHLPHVSVEFEPGCTPKEIVDGYNMALNTKVHMKPSNANSKKPK
jgi:hypothetical protein